MVSKNHLFRLFFLRCLFLCIFQRFVDFFDRLTKISSNHVCSLSCFLAYTAWHTEEVHKKIKKACFLEFQSFANLPAVDCSSNAATV